MATWQAVNVLTGAVEGPKYTEIGAIEEIWVATLTTALANGDTVLGPTMPAGCFLTGITVDTDALDSGAGITFEAGYTGHLAAFIATGNTTAQTGGIQSANVAGVNGLTSTSNIQALVTITHVATTPVAGKMRIKLSYTANP
jgi:hypothetical protein